MKRKFCKSLLSIIAMAMCVALTISTSVTAEAAKKKKTTKVKTEDEIILDQLTGYRDALIKAGASETEIALAQQSVDAQQNLMLVKKAQAEARAQYLANIANNQAILTKGISAPTTGVILVGDSRFVQMHQAVGETGAIYIAEERMGYNWLVEEAIPRIDALATKGSKIVINLGVNDPGNIDRYIETVNNWTYTWTLRGAKVYYATVNPVWTNPYTSKEQVDNFNQKLKTGLVGVNIIDSNAYLSSTKLNIVDGLHYDNPTYTTIYLFLMGSI